MILRLEKADQSLAAILTLNTIAHAAGTIVPGVLRLSWFSAMRGSAFFRR